LREKFTGEYSKVNKAALRENSINVWQEPLLPEHAPKSHSNDGRHQQQTEVNQLG
jgi:hypothetical protein